MRIRTLAKRTVAPCLLALGLCATFDAGATAFVVNNAGSGLNNGTTIDCLNAAKQCTLHAAINQGNGITGPHTITFTVAQINLAADIPQMRAKYLATGPVIINGGGTFSCLDLADSGTENATIHNGLGADGSVISLFNLQNCHGHGISANGHGYSFLTNFIGTNALGTAAAGNSGHGISISSSRVYSQSIYDSISSLFNSFPVNPLSSADVANFSAQIGTYLTNVGLGPVTIAGNVISGNAQNGIEIFSENLAGVIVTGNMIGTDVTGNIAIGNGGSGVHFTGSPFGNVIGPGNVISGNLAHGIDDAAGAVALPNFIVGNRIGLSATLPGANIGNGLSGIVVDSRPETAIAHFNPAMTALVISAGNVISDNKGANNNAFPDVLGGDNAGILITGASDGIKVMGNVIGLGEFPPGTPVSSLAYGNAGDGIIVTVPGITIGGAAGNVIAGNARHGIVIRGSGTHDTKVLGNSIGVHPGLAGDLTLGNGVDGIHIDAASTSFIGEADGTGGNVIAANGRNGIKMRNGNYSNGWGHLIRRNTIYGNGVDGTGIGIDIDHPENLPDDPSFEIPQNYANLDQAAPVICTGNAGACSGYSPVADSGGTTTLDYTLKTHDNIIAAALAKYRIEFFKINAPSVNAATSMTFLGEQVLDTDGSGALVGCPGGRCSASLPAPSGGSYIVATATDITEIPDTLGQGWLQLVKCLFLTTCNVNNTSEFSNVAQSTLVAVPTTTVVTIVDPQPTSNNTNSAASVYGQAVAVTATVTANSGSNPPTGSITINADGASCNAALGNPSGTTSKGTCTLSPPPSVGGPYAVSATYAGTPDFAASASSAGGNGSLTVGKASTSTAVTADTPDPSNVGAPIAVTAIVSVTVPGSGTPTGSILVAISGGAETCTITLPATSCNLVPLASGTRDITATYGGDANFLGSDSTGAPESHVVDPAAATATTTAVTVVQPQGSGNATNTGTSVYGQPVDVTAVVTGAGTAPTGTVTINTVGSSCQSASGTPNGVTYVVTCTLTPTVAVGGPYTITASYGGDGTFAPSASSGAGNGALGVNKADTTTSVTYAAGPSNVNAAIAVNANVTPVAPGAGVPTGTVTVTISGGAESCTITLPATSCNLVPTAPGSRTITATYNGDGNFNGSFKTGPSYTVDAGGGIATTTAIMPGNVGTFVYGQAIPVTVAVTAQTGVTPPDGSAMITAGAGSCLATLSPSAGTTATGTCNLAPALAAAGSAYTVSASYAGNATFAASNSAGAGDGTVTVNKANVTASITSDNPDPSFVDAPVAAVVALAVAAPGAGTPTGTITVKSDSPTTDLCTITLPANSCNITLTATGTKSLTATYNGDGNFNANTSAGASHVVNPAGATATSAAITIVQPQGSANATPTATSVYGQPVAVTGTVTAQTGGAAPDGTITLSAGGSSCNVALGSPAGLTSKGTCTLAPATIPANAAPYTVAIGYSGTATFAASNASDGTLTVGKADTTTTISADSPDPSNVNASFSVTAGVVPAAPGTGTPTGTITIGISGGAETCVITLPATSCNLTATSQGARTLTATYSGDANFNGSVSAGVDHTVNSGGLIDTTTVVSLVSPGAIVYSQQVDVTVSVTAASGNNAPNGNVTVNAGASSCQATLSSPVNLTSTGTCSVVPPLAPSGSAYAVTASYGGTPTFGPSSSSGGGNGALDVSKASTSTAITGHTPNPSFVLTGIAVSAGVAVTAPGSGTPTGTILVSDGAANCVITLPATSCNLTPTTSGAKTLTATYSGDANFNPSNGGTAHTVQNLTVYSAPTAVPGVSATVTISGGAAGCTMVGPVFLPPPATPPVDVTFPFGLFRFAAANCGVGATVNVQIVYSQALPPGTQYWKYGPTPGNASAHWYVMPGSAVNGTTVNFSITDGQTGDDDLTADGVIVDDGGPGRLPTAVPTLDETLRVLLAIVLAALGALALGRRRPRATRDRG